MKLDLLVVVGHNPRSRQESSRMAHACASAYLLQHACNPSRLRAQLSLPRGGQRVVSLGAVRVQLLAGPLASYTVSRPALEISARADDQRVHCRPWYPIPGPGYRYCIDIETIGL